MINISTENDFDIMLQDERALLFIWVDWGLAQASRPAVIKLHEQWNQAHPDSQANLYWVDFSDQIGILWETVRHWLTEQRITSGPLTYGGWGALIWVCVGSVVDFVGYPGQTKFAQLLEQTQTAFS